MTREELLADAQQRKADAESARADLFRQAQALNTEGVKIEQALFGIEGEIKALTALGESVG